MLIPLYLLALLQLQISKSSPSESGRGFVGQLIENKHGKVFLLRNAKEYKEDQEKKQEENRREKDEDGGKNDYKGEADDFMVENILLLGKLLAAIKDEFWNGVGARVSCMSKNKPFFWWISSKKC